MAKDGGYILPTNPNVEETTCINLIVPNDPEYRRAVWGALWRLTFKSEWHKGDEAVIDTVVNRMQEMWWSSVEAWNEEGGGCVSFDIRVIGGMLQKTYDGTTWLDVSPIQVGDPIQSVEAFTLPAGDPATATLINGVLTLGIPQGYQGLQGVQGEPGTNGTAGAAGADATMPVGTVVWYAGSNPPSGWYPCIGLSMEITAFPDLYAAIGTTYGVGTSPPDTFQIPDLRDRFIKGSLANLGTIGGQATTTLGVNNLPAHNHSHSHTVAPHIHDIQARTSSGFGNTERLAATNTGGTSVLRQTEQNAQQVTSTDATNTGGGEAFSNEPEYMLLQPIICVVPNSPLNVEFQVTACELEWRKDGGAWSTLVDLTTCTTPGAQGAQGIQGVQGVPGDCECSDSPPPIASDQETWCGIANTITAYMNVYLEDLLDRIDATTSIAQAASSLFGTIPVIGWETDAVVETITEATNATTNGVRADITQATIDLARDELFTLLVANGGYSFAVLEQWRDEQALYWALQLNTGMVVYMSVVNDLSSSDWSRQAYLGSLAPSTECEETVPCESTIQRRWFPPEQNMTDPEADGTISPAPPSTFECGVEWIMGAYAGGTTVTFTLDTPLPANAVEIAVYVTEVAPGNFQTPDAMQVLINGEDVGTDWTGGFTNTCLAGTDGWTSSNGNFQTMVETVTFTFPATRAQWWLRHIYFEECIP